MDPTVNELFQDVGQGMAVSNILKVTINFPWLELAVDPYNNTISISMS